MKKITETRKTLHLKLMILFAMTVFYNIYTLTDIARNRSEMFHMPSLSNGVLDLPSIYIAFPLWIGLNWLCVRAVNEQIGKLKKIR